MALERTLGIVKPDAVAKGHIGEILTTIEENDFRIVQLKMLRLSIQGTEAFYAVHKARPFFPDLVAFMTEGPVVAAVLERESAVAKWREVMGATNPADAREGTIRKRFASSIERNCVHGSDAAETAAQEISFFFSTAELL
ncbi:MAG: nucleoside-diphosphate kinase [Acidobacteriaceae bacterium]|nr:nucleoside-diphosphate kinase [Acidobacteriaceae bacterium]MBV9296300.1 nucleoside-diphosphate kinase [Acidobacteriaceae bacterium]MBV9767325.1 nucleoside-diphosphate kinase [Acidobacteriaceae bacterium]